MRLRTARRRPARQGADRNSLIGQHPLTPYLFSTPALVLVSAILAFPVLYAFYGSLFRQHALERESPFIGFGNYAAIFSDPSFWASVSRSVIFLTGVLVLGTILALVFGFTLARAVGRLRFLRTVTLLPYIVSGVATAVMFRMLFHREFGLPNKLLELLGFDGLGWLADPNLAMVTIILAHLWGDLPLCTLLILGGIQSIDPEYLDAASVDGATGWKRIRHISIPLIAPQIALSTVLLAYGGVTAFAVVLALTGGGPGTATELLGIKMYFTAFRVLDMGQALAIVVTLLLLNCALVVLFLWLGRARDAE